MSFKLHLIWASRKLDIFPDISYLSELQKINFQFLTIILLNDKWEENIHWKLIWIV